MSFATPASTALIGKVTAFGLGLEYQNPISAPVTLSDGMVSMNLDSQKLSPPSRKSSRASRKR